MAAIREYIGQGETIIYITESCEKFKTFSNSSKKPEVLKKQLLKIAEFEKKLNDKRVRFNMSDKYGKMVFHWTHVYKGQRAPGKKIKRYERLLKQQRIRFKKTMDDIKAKFTWDTTEVSFL